MIGANQVVAASNAIRFRYDDGTTFLNWSTGESVDHAIWFGMVLVVVTLFNMLPVRVSEPKPHPKLAPYRLSVADSVQIYGELEYAIGSIKLLIIIMTILLLLIIDTMKRKNMEIIES